MNTSRLKAAINVKRFRLNSNLYPTSFARRAAMLLITLALFSLPIYAQNFKATVVGVVTDTTGAAVTGATVTVTEAETAFEQTATTTDDGSFTVAQLPPGTYEIRVDAANFKRTVQTDLLLETDQTQRLNITLEAGDVNETVTIVAEAPVINSDTSEKGEVITNRQVQELPLNGRDATDLAQLVPGVYQRPAEDDQGQGLAAAGTRTDSTNFILDGVNNRSDRNGGIGVNTSVDSIREFKVSTSSYSAEFGRTAGAQINVVSKSGTNRYSGSLFDFARNNVFDAKNALAFDVPSTSSDESKKTLRRNQFGGTIGGALPFFNFGEGGPVFSSGKDRTFFFASYEGTREVRSAVAIKNAPNADWLNGDFRNVRGAGANGRLGDADDTNRVLRPVATVNANGSVTVTRVEFPTPNVIPRTLFNPISAQLLAFIPAANLPSSVVGAPSSNYLATGVNDTNRNQFLAKIDHRISDKNTFYVSFARQSANNFDAFPSNRNFYPGFGRDVRNNYNTLSISDTNIFSSRFINEARFGYFRQRNENLGENRGTDFNALLGIPFPAGYSPGAELQGFPAIRIDGFEEFGDRPNDPFTYSLRNFQFYDVATFIAGKHSFKFGGDIVNSNYVEADVRNVRGDFRFRGRSTNTGTGTTGSGAGNTSGGFRSFADFLLGLPDATQLQFGSVPADLRGTQYAFFVQDDWRIHPRLTLNLGLRYELQQPLREASGRLATFIPGLRQVVLSGDARFSESLIQTDKNNFGPRVGFAFRPFDDDRTVIRGGGGIYHSLESFNVSRQQLANNFPFLNRTQFNRPFISATSTTRNPVGLSISNPFPTNTLSAANDVFGIDTQNRTPEFYQYNLTIERELISDLALEVGYVGSLGRYLGRRYNINQSIITGLNADGTLRTVNPFADVANIGSGTIQYQEQTANSNYNSLQTSLRRRLKNELTLLVSYTFSRAIDDASSTNTSTTGAQQFPQNIYNLRAERALSDFHRQHQFSSSFNYSLPFGRGRAFLGEARGIVQQLLGGYQINGIYTYLSGRPFTPRFNAPDIGQQRPDLISNPYENIPEGLLFNPLAFRRPTTIGGEADLFGNAGRNILTGPNFSNFNASLLKNFRLGERTRIQFRAEAFNVFNHPNYQVPGFILPDDLTLTIDQIRASSTIGRVTATANEGRELQFALKLLF